MKKIKLLAVMMAIFTFFCVFAACGKTDPNQPETPENPDPPVVELPEFDENGNKYVDLVTVSELGEITYNGINGFIDGYDKYGSFEDVHSDISFDFGGKAPEDVLGIVHAGGQYNFTEQPYLTEGANIIRRDIGSRVIKLFLGSDIADQYSFNEEWGAYTSLKELIQNEEIRAVFDMDFSTIVMVAYEFERLQWGITTPVAEAELARVEKEFYDFAYELIRRYNDSGKTFIIQNWEGDNELKEALDKLSTTTDKDTVIQNYIDYNNARQRGIAQARKELIEERPDEYGNVEIYGALEINFGTSTQSTQPKLIDRVVPYSEADMFSRSFWTKTTADLQSDLESYLQQINLYRDETEKKTMSDIYLGEYGGAENLSTGTDEEWQFNYALETAKIAINLGVRFVCYWDLYCNERVGGETARPVNEDMKGFWLIKPDGSFTKLFWYFKGMFEDKNFLELETKPSLIMRQPAPAEEIIPFPENEADILFYDNFDDVDLDGKPAIQFNEKWEDYSDGMNYDHIKEADQAYMSKYFADYGLTPEIGFTVVQKKPNNPDPEYIQYKVVRSAEDADGKFVMKGFIYDPTPKSNIKVMGTKNGTDYETLDSAYFMDKTGTYGYLYVTTRIPVGYTSIRVMFTNIKSANSWDPLICYAAFIK